MKKVFKGENLGEIAQKVSENTKLFSNFPRLVFGLFLPNSSQNWAVFKCYLLNKHPPIRLHEKKLFNFGENLGEIRFSQKVSENTKLISNFPRLVFGLFLPNSH